MCVTGCAEENSGVPEDLGNETSVSFIAIHKPRDAYSHFIGVHPLDLPTCPAQSLCLEHMWITNLMSAVL